MFTIAIYAWQGLPSITSKNADKQNFLNQN